MSLYEEYARTCTILKPVSGESEEGGWTTTWEDGATFVSYVALLSSGEVRRAEKDGLSVDYAALVARDTPIAYNDYFRDNDTGKTYRVTSNPDDKHTPPSATFDFKYFEAEKRPLP